MVTGVLNKIVNNEICGINGCSKHADTSIYFSLGFSANFCKECANALVAKGLGVEVSSIRNATANSTKLQEYEIEEMKNQDPQDVF
jgi:hypothetical protein